LKEGRRYTRKSTKESNQNVTKLRDLIYELCLTECGSVPLEIRRLGADQTEVLKILNGYENIY